MQPKISVFTGSLSYSVIKGIVEIDRQLPNASWLIVVHTPKRSVLQLVDSQVRNLRRNGWRWIPYETWDLLQRRFMSTRSDRDRQGAPGYAYTAESLTGRRNIELLHVDDIHAADTVNLITAFAPDVGLSLAAPILKRSVFSIPTLGTLNLHKGSLPDYRGMPPAFWELWNDDSVVGCSVHWVDDRLDTGNVVCQTTLPRQRFSTVRGMQVQLDEVGIRLMNEAVSRVLRNSAQSTPQAAHGKTYRKPTLAQIRVLERRLLSNQTPPTSLAARAVKHACSVAALGLWRIGLGRVFRSRIIVLLYHRVTDEVRDNLTVGIEQFERQMATIRSHFQPISIEEVLASKSVSVSSRPLVTVTFDDGYLDNYTNAAPILQRHGVPAAFFVSTDIIGKNGRFPHDVRRGNPHIPLMDWDQLREMQGMGFTIGSHSANHIDCAKEPEERVRQELVESRDALRRELNISDPIFAYPYGGKEHMTAGRLGLVKEAGYAGCLSAYGGTNLLPIDCYNVLRRGIQWEFAHGAFLFECLGLR